VQPGGCAANCSAAEKEHYSQFVCGRKPLCAVSCPEDVPPTCETVDTFTGAGGCGSTCSDQIKADFKHEVCHGDISGWHHNEGSTKYGEVEHKGYERPPCASSCMNFDQAQKEFTTPCAMYESFTAGDGCMASCTQEVKDTMKEHACDRNHKGFAWGEEGNTRSWKVAYEGYERPSCASNCPSFDQAQKEFTTPCRMYESFTAADGCMASCTQGVKDTMKEHSCERNVNHFAWGEAGNTRSWKVRYEGYVKPPCASSCQEFDQAQKAFESPCAMYESFTKGDGCMASCTQEVKDTMKENACEHNHEGYAWGEAGAGHTIEEEEAVLKKFDDIVAGAESEASLPDSRHTTPEPQEDEEESNKSTYMCIAFVLVSLCACWSYAGFAFHRWALSPKKELLVETEGESEAEAS